MSDLPTLARTLGQRGFFADRLRRQDEGRGVLLVAWLEGAPVGDVYVWLEEPEEPELRERLPGVPLLNHLEVHAGYRRRGIGTTIVGTAERLVAAEGRDRLALGVDPGNSGATRLYERLGYELWPFPDIKTTYEEFFDDGTSRRIAETCRVLVKRLGGPGGTPGGSARSGRAGG